MNVIDYFFTHLSLTNGVTSSWHLIDTSHILIWHLEVGKCAFSLMFGKDSRCFISLCVCVFLFQFCHKCCRPNHGPFARQISQFPKLGGGCHPSPYTYGYKGLENLKQQWIYYSTLSVSTSFLFTEITIHVFISSTKTLLVSKVPCQTWEGVFH